MGVYAQDDWTDGGYFCPGGEPESAKRGLPLLFEAIQHRQSTRIVRSIIESNYPVSVRDPVSNMSVLEMSVSENSDDSTFRYLFDTMVARCGSETLFKGPSGGTLMHVACYTQSPAYIISMIADEAAQQADSGSEHAILHHRDDLGRTPLHHACATGIPADSVREMLMRDPTIAEEADRSGLVGIQIAVKSRALPGVVFEVARANSELVSLLSPQGHSLLQMAVMHDAPPHVVFELLEVAPNLITTVQVFDPSFPSNEASAEVRRLAMTAPKKLAPFKTKHSRVFDEIDQMAKEAEAKAKAKAAAKKKLPPEMKPVVKASGYFNWLWN